MTLSLALGLVAIIAAIVAGVSFSRHSDTAQANPSKIWVVNGQVLQTHDGGLCGGVCDPTTAAGRAKFKGTLDTIQTDSTDASGDVEVSMCAPGCSLPPPGGDTWVLAQTDGSGTPVSLNGRGLGCTPLCDGTATQVPDATDHFVVYRIANTGTHSGGDTLISTASEDAVTLDSIVMLITGGCGAPTPTNTPMGSPTGTFTATPTITPSPTPTAPPTPTATPGQGACPTVIGLETWPCLALVLKIQCASLNIPPALDAVAARSAGLTPPELLARGSLDGGLTPLVLPSDLAGIDVDANQLHEQDGVMWVVAFVGSADPVTFTTTRGSFITPISVSVGSQMTCGPAGQVTNDADCNGGTRGDGVVVARLDAMGAARGPGTVTVSQRGVAQSMAFTVVGEPQTISLDAVPSQLDTSRDPPIVSSLATAVSSGSSTVVVSADILAGRALPADIVIDPLAPPLVERVTVVSKAGGTYTLQAGKLNATGDLRLSGTANPHAVGAAVTTADTCADRYTAGGLNAALARPDRTLIIARPKDSDGTIVANAVVTFTSSNSQIAEAPVVVAPSMGLGSYGIGAPMVICGGTLPGDATVTAALARTLPPPFPGLAVDPLAGTDSHIVPLHVAIPCSDFDLNHDGRVGFPDLYALALAYNSRPGNPAWNPAADFIADSKVGFDDLYQLALHYNQKC